MSKRLSIMLLAGLLIFGIVGVGLVSASEDPSALANTAVAGEPIAEEGAECPGDCEGDMLQKQIRLQKQDGTGNCDGECTGENSGSMLQKQERKQLNKQECSVYNALPNS